MKHYVGPIFLQQRFVESGPRLLEHGPGAAHLLPHLFADKRSERSQQQDDLLQHLATSRRGEGRLMGVEFVDQLHKGRDRRVEMPPTFKVLGDLPNRLVQLSQHLAIGLARLPGFVQPINVARHKPKHAAKEAGGPLGPGVRPIQVAFRRGGEEFEQATGVGTELVHHRIGTDDVALVFGHLRAVFDHHALRE